MTHLLDTNTCIYIINRKPPAVLERFKQLQPGSLGVSSITVAELKFGVYKSTWVKQNLEALEMFLLPFMIADFDDAAADYYGKIRASLQTAGTPLGSLDMLIAAHALALEVTLVTNNTREFSAVGGLPLEDWTQAQ